MKKQDIMREAITAMKEDSLEKATVKACEEIWNSMTSQDKVQIDMEQLQKVFKVFVKHYGLESSSLSVKKSRFTNFIAKSMNTYIPIIKAEQDKRTKAIKKRLDFASQDIPIIQLGYSGLHLDKTNPIVKDIMQKEALVAKQGSLLPDRVIVPMRTKIPTVQERMIRKANAKALKNALPINHDPQDSVESKRAGLESVIDRMNKAKTIGKWTLKDQEFLRKNYPNILRKMFSLKRQGKKLRI